MKRNQLVTAILLFLGIGLWFFSKIERGSDIPIGTVEESKTIENNSETNTTVSTNTNASENTTKTESVTSQIPPISKIREEVAKDPHATPPALLEFASYMATRMEPALKSPQAAKELLGELRDCVANNNDFYPPIKATCAINTLRLIETHGEKAIDLNKEDYLRSLSPELQKTIEIHDAIN